MKLLSRPCDSCPWRARLDLRRGRLKQLADLCRDKDVHFICHKALDRKRLSELEDEREEAALQGKEPESLNYTGAGDDVMCRGWYDAHPGVGLARRLAEGWGLIKVVEPPGESADESPAKK